MNKTKGQNISRIEKKTSDADHIYYNISIQNNTTDQLQLALYNAPRTTALLENPSDYYCSIIRFQVPLQDVPIFVFRDGTYSVTISYAGSEYQAFLIYVPNYTINAIPSDPAFARYVFSYQEFIDSINNALQTAFNNFLLGLPIFNPLTIYAIGDIVQSGGIAYTSLQNANVGNVPSLSPAFWTPLIAPYLTFDPVTELITINASVGFYTSAFSSDNQPVKLWFNTPLNDFFHNFQTLFNNSLPTPFNTNGKNFNILIKDDFDNRIILRNGSAGYAMTQEYVSLYNWNDLRNIVFLTTTIPIRAEGTPAIPSTPSFFVSNSTTSPAYQPILTDFQILQNLGPEGRSNAQFYSQGEYRLVDMIGTTPLVNIDLQIFWQDKFLNLYPLYIPSLNSADVKILFRRKSIKGSLSYYN